MEEAITAGIGVNVTLLFSDTHYLRTADAYLRALQRRRRAGLDLGVPSVASVFISRWDSAADPLLPSALHGSLGLAMAQKTYDASHVNLRSDPRWAGACRGRRPPAAGSVGLHLDQEPRPARHLPSGPGEAAPNTIDTVPEKTLLAFADHGSLDDRLGQPHYAAAERAIATTADAGIDADVLAEHLQRQGAGAFTADWAALLTAIKETNPHANGGLLMRELDLPDIADYAVTVETPGAEDAEATVVMAEFLRDVMRDNARHRNFRVFGPDETASNRLSACVRGDDRAWDAETLVL